ncbi:MAG: hypothetical protein ACYCZO_07535 [Daejeonella sp.]
MGSIRSNIGIFAAFAIISAWFISLLFLMRWEISLSNPLLYVMILVQMHLYTGLFIKHHESPDAPLVETMEIEE